MLVPGYEGVRFGEGVSTGVLRVLDLGRMFVPGYEGVRFGEGVSTGVRGC